MRLITKTLTVLLISLAAAKAQAIEPFVVEDIQVEGLQRVELGTFFTTLPIRVGETLDEARVPNIIRAVYKTGNFDFVKLEKEGSTLKLLVVERPVISSIVFTGNKVLKTEQLIENMEQSGIAKGEALNSFILEKIEQAITNEYFNNGHYHLGIEKKLIELPRNRVQLLINVKEGQSAKIKKFNIVGNNLFPDEELLSNFELTEGGLFSFITDDNKYSNQRLDKDIEALNSYYKDRGYLKFSVDKTLVSLSDNREEIYITLMVNEGDIFKINEVTFVGDLKIDSEVYERVSPFKKGDNYSEALSTFLEEQIKSLLSLSGYTFSEVKVLPQLLEETNEVDLRVLVQPGDRYYAGDITFSGNISTDDNVFRRELRFQEGAPLSSVAIERTKQRIQRLPFVEEVSVDTKKSAEKGIADVIYEIKERNSSEATFSLGYNDFSGLQLAGGITNRNFFGEAKTFGINLSANKAIKSLSLNYSDPYFFRDIIGLNTSLSFRETDFSAIDQIGRSLDTISVGAGLYYPISETSSVSFGFNYEDSKLSAPILNRRQDQGIIDFFENLGEDFRVIDEVEFNVLSANLSWQKNTLNRFIFPTSGYSHDVDLEYATPAGNVEYYKIGYDYRHYIPISDSGWIFALKASLGYGDGIGETGRLPYFVNYFAGGSSSIRGFEGNTVGPDSVTRIINSLSAINPIPGGIGNPPGTIGDPLILPDTSDSIVINNRFSVGGNAKAIASMEIIFPVPFVEKSNNLRTGFFVDVGNVWDTEFDLSRFEGLDVLTIGNQESSVIPDYSDASRYRGSYGIYLQWWSPFAPLQFSLAKTFNTQLFDETKTFTFTIGQTF